MKTANELKRNYTKDLETYREKEISAREKPSEMTVYEVMKFGNAIASLFQPNESGIIYESCVSTGYSLSAANEVARIAKYLALDAEVSKFGTSTWQVKLTKKSRG